jgi:hypothetical protein
MPIGTAGSTLCAELNRLANGGTYPARTVFLDEQGAANKWAGTTGKAIIGALNYKVNSSRQPSAFKDLNGVCNELAGTTGKSAIDALRSIAS